MKHDNTIFMPILFFKEKKYVLATNHNQLIFVRKIFQKLSQKLKGIHSQVLPSFWFIRLHTQFEI